MLTDYGAFRDLQRHRPLTIEWQTLGTGHGYELPREVEEAGLRADWERVLEASAQMEQELAAAGHEEAAQYAVSMAYRIRFVMQMSAREAMHQVELRSQPQGHPTYRRVAQAMHAEIARVHPAIGAAFTYLSTEDAHLERLEAERRTEAKRNAAGGAPPYRDRVERGRASPAQRRACTCMSCQPSSCRSELRMTPSSGKPARSATRHETSFRVEWWIEPVQPEAVQRPACDRARGARRHSSASGSGKGPVRDLAVTELRFTDRSAA